MMSITTVSSLNRSMEKTQVWLKDLVEIGHLDSEAQGYSILRAVLHALRDHLTVEETADLAAQLPLVLRGTFYETWKPSRVPVAEHSADEFIERIRQETRHSNEVDPVHAFRCVAALLDRKISAGEMADVHHMMPKEIRKLWPNPN
jgi:uncharacterized protein (DUF2267 family)